MYRSFLKKISASVGFLPEDLVMLDCEMTGVVPKRDHLLQVAALRLKRDGVGYKEVGEPFLVYLSYLGEPENEFHRKYLLPVFEQCRQSVLTPKDVKDALHLWLGSLKGHVSATGDCVATDVAFLLEKGCADVADIGTLGTFHYESFEMHPVKLIARHLVNSKFETPGVDKDRVHDALVDCRNQLLELNHCLKIICGAARDANA